MNLHLTKNDTSTDFLTKTNGRAKQQTLYQNGVSSKSSLSPCWSNTWREPTRDILLQGCEAACDIAKNVARYTNHKEHEYGIRASTINNDKCSLTKESQSLARTVIPHNLSPVLGATNPLDQSTEIADFRTLIQATFQANTKPTAMLS